MSGRKAVITGIGLTTPLGIGLEENWKGLSGGKSGIRHYPKGDLPRCFQYFGKVEPFEVTAAPSPSLGPQMKFLNRGALLGYSSSCEALRQAGADLSTLPPSRRALYVASGDLTKIGCEFLYPALKEGTEGKGLQPDFEKLNQATLSQVNPFFLLESIANNLFSFLSAFGQFMGPNTSLSSLSPSGSHALELAFRCIVEGKAEIALAVGYGSWISEIPLYELQGLSLLSRCEIGAQSFRPFDSLRDGFIPGEGGAAVLVEAEDVARSRGARVRATIRGCGNAIALSPGGGLAVPERVCSRSLRLALDEAGCSVSDLAFLGAHGSATQKGDRSELISILELLEKEQAETPICGMKPYTGHMGAASDLAEVALGICAVRNQMVPATLNFTSIDDEFSKIPVLTRHGAGDKKLFLSASYGIGGQSSCLILSVP
jgi:3-oxoacyl-[acyl-carrier-protein] synthase II